MANNENAIVNTTPTVSETPADLVGKKADGKLSPNPAGFGFTKQVQVDSLPDSGAFDTLYLLRIYDANNHVKDYYLYKWTYDRAAGVEGGRTQPHWERVYNPVNNVVTKDGEHDTPVHENTAPKAAPEKVFKGLVLFNEEPTIKGLPLGEFVDKKAGGVTEQELHDYVKPNPTLAGTETELTGIKIGGTKYRLPTIPQELPDVPEQDGTYTLQCVVSGGAATLSWVAVEPANDSTEE